MNGRKLALTITAVAAMSTALPAFAGRDPDNSVRNERHFRNDQEYDARRSEQRFGRYVDMRQTRQRHRIKNGIESGELTRKEAKRLQRQQRKIARLEEKFSSDHYFSRKERRILKEKLDKASRSIYRKKHNDRDMYKRYATGIWKPRDYFGEYRHGNHRHDYLFEHAIGALFWR